MPTEAVLRLWPPLPGGAPPAGSIERRRGGSWGLCRGGSRWRFRLGFLELGCLLSALRPSLAVFVLVVLSGLGRLCL